MDLTKNMSAKQVSTYTGGLNLFQQSFKHISNEWRSAFLWKTNQTKQNQTE